MAFRAERRFDATKVHSRTFPLEDLPTALHYAPEWIDDVTTVFVSMRESQVARRSAAE